MNEDVEKAASQPEAGKAIIVGIGASAGGIHALQTFFDGLSPPTSAAFVVIVHLDPQSRSDLSGILRSRTQMPVIQVTGAETLRPDHVYVIPPDRRLQITDHVIAAVEFDEPRGRRAPIDLFFRSLAEHGDGFAVILSGAGSDGAIGVKAVKEAGGIIIVQDPAEAEYPSMPRSAISTGVTDFILPVRGIADRLPDLIRAKQTISDGPELDEELLRRILAYVRVRTGHDFSKYKRSTVIRRIGRRMQVTRTESLRDYDGFLRNNPSEAQELLADLLISVTTFFRDGAPFEALKKLVLQKIFDNKDQGDPVRVWVPGCATGEEAYSIGMLLLEEVARHDSHFTIQVFASDLDARALTLAREGRYPAAIEADVSEERLRRFFGREQDGYRVRQELRDIVLFASHNLLKDPPFSRIDLISCRNMLIYLDRELQPQVCSAFHYALNPGGFLFLGSSETADNPPGLFRTVDRGARIYQSTAHPGDKPRLLPRLLDGGLGITEQAAQVHRPLTPAAALNEAATHRRIIEKEAPPSLLVDQAHRVVHMSDSVGRYMQPMGGSLSGDAVDLVRPELRFELRSALHRAFEQRRAALTLPIFVQFNGAPHRVLLQVRPILKDESSTESPRALVMFIEDDASDQVPLQPDEQTSSDETVRRLTQELELTQGRLRTVREESDAANEELRAANEELQSINEEYRSTSEELETSKEELQSINEELQTVNSELKLKLEAISRAHSDLLNLMAATDFGTLFLDSSLRIKRFTDRVTDLFSLAPGDEGRPITDFAHQLEYGDLVEDAQSVLTQLAAVKREVQSRDGQWYDVRMRPYRTVDDKIDGVVITFVDITDRRKVENALLHQQRLVNLSRDPIFVWDFDGGIVEWNRGSEDLYGFSREEAIGKRKETILQTSVPGSSFEELRAALVRDGSWAGELGQKTKDGRSLIVESRLQLESVNGQRLVLESTRDITDRKRWESRQQLLLGELVHRVKNTLSVVQSIAQQTLRGTSSVDDFAERFGGRLSALATSHSLLVQSEWQGADLAALARSQLEPYVSENIDQIRIDGEPIILPADLATPFGLVLHELATNASKHGSLSDSTGTVHVSWTLKHRDGAQILAVVWEEKGGPPVKRPTHVGLGSTLIESGIPTASVKREFRPDGLVCTIELSLPHSIHGAEPI